MDWRGGAAVAALALVVTAVIAAPVLLAPSERLFGTEIVGRNHDPFTVMQQFLRPISLGVYTQPVTDVAGALLARVMGPVAAYNLLVLLSFPLSAAAAYLLGRHLALSPAGAALAALAFAFSPFHLAHAAYHVHIAQTQWLPLYLLALLRCLDEPTPKAVGLLAVATACVTLSNFYGGLIAAVITPVAIAAYWLGRARAGGAIDAPVARHGREPAADRRRRDRVRLVRGPRASSPTPRPSPSAARTSSATARSGGPTSSRPSRTPLLGDFARRIWLDSGVGGGCSSSR